MTPVRLDEIGTPITNPRGCVLPGGNNNEFPAIRRELKKRHVPFAEAKIPGGVVFLCFEVEGLPTDVREGDTFSSPYLPTGDDSGHTVYEITPRMLADLQYRSKA